MKCSEFHTILSVLHSPAVYPVICGSEIRHNDLVWGLNFWEPFSPGHNATHISISIQATTLLLTEDNW